MTISIIPAQPGYFAVDKVDGKTLHLPVIAWWIRQMLDSDVDVWAVGVGGKIDAECPIYGPDGKLAHE